jgi:hypothetical protein
LLDSKSINVGFILWHSQKKYNWNTASRYVPRPSGGLILLEFHLDFLFYTYTGAASLSFVVVL